MFRILYLWIRKYLLHIDDRSLLEIAISNGLTIGENCHIMGECIIDPGHCWLISIGNNVTLAPRVHILAHDASTKKELGYTVIGRVTIGNNVFIGAGSIILPNVTIGDNVIIGAGSVVARSVPSNKVVAGSPIRVIADYSDYMEKRKEQMKHAPLFDSSYTITQITDDKKNEMKDKLNNDTLGFIK